MYVLATAAQESSGVGIGIGLGIGFLSATLLVSIVFFNFANLWHLEFHPRLPNKSFRKNPLLEKRAMEHMEHMEHIDTWNKNTQ